MEKYIVESVCADGDKHAVYIRICDTDGTPMHTVCVPYDGNEENFKKALAGRLEKIKSVHQQKEKIKTDIQKLLDQM